MLANTELVACTVRLPAEVPPTSLVPWSTVQCVRLIVVGLYTELRLNGLGTPVTSVLLRLTVVPPRLPEPPVHVRAIPWMQSTSFEWLSVRLAVTPEEAE